MISATLWFNCLIVGIKWPCQGIPLHLPAQIDMHACNLKDGIKEMRYTRRETGPVALSVLSV